MLKKLAWKWKLNLAKIPYTKSTAITLLQGKTLSRNHILLRSFCWLWTGTPQRLWFNHLLHISETVLQRCFHKRMFWKYTLNLQENTYAGVSQKLQSNFIEKSYCCMGFSVRFVTYYQITYGGLILTFISSHKCHCVRFKTQTETFSCDVQFIIKNVSRTVVKFHFHY